MFDVSLHLLVMVWECGVGVSLLCIGLVGRLIALLMTV
jgi:hypothetical protein